jgi:hypothetical protein
MPYVRTVPYEEAEGDLKSAYDTMLNSRGMISNVHAARSLRPHIINTLVDHVRAVMFTE